MSEPVASGLNITKQAAIDFFSDIGNEPLTPQKLTFIINSIVNFRLKFRRLNFRVVIVRRRNNAHL